MVYLSRTEGSTIGEIQWKFDFSGKNLTINNVYLELVTYVYENGEVDVDFIHEGEEFQLPKNMFKHF